jgi:hypothetical protein
LTIDLIYDRIWPESKKTDFLRKLKKIKIKKGGKICDLIKFFLKH